MDDSRIYPSVPVRPADEECYRGCLWEVRIEHPVDNEWRVFVGRIFWTDDERPEEVPSVFVGPYYD
jgi:hypothetical protein